MKILSTATAASILLTPVIAGASTWKLDPTHSEVGFRVSHLVIAKVRGRFNAFQGTLNLDDKDPSKSKVEVEIETASINTNDEKRDEHLRSPEFFDAKAHPKITFRSRKVERAGNDQFKVLGDLSIRGVTKPVTLDVTAPSKEVLFYGKSRRVVTATTKINRQDFGVKWNSKLDGGGFVVGDEVEIEISAELVKE